MASCSICIDAGTTNTRVWLVCGEQIIARAGAMVGVRDTAREGSSERLYATLRDLIAEVSAHCESREPAFVAAAGMITSALGLVEVPHITAPAGIAELAANVSHCEFPAITQLPVLLVPGVRTGPRDADLNNVNAADVMRGEETMCMGLLAAGLAKPPCTVINLGSHWKVINIDADGRIAGSRTSLAGELVHAAQTQTILASAVPQTRPESLEQKWIEAGMREQRSSGLARALFCVRLLEQGGRSTPQERLAFLIGAFIASDLDPLLARKELVEPTIIAGPGAIAEAWRGALGFLAPQVLSQEELELALLAGLRCLTRSQ